MPDTKIYFVDKDGRLATDDKPYPTMKWCPRAGGPGANVCGTWCPMFSILDETETGHKFALIECGQHLIMRTLERIEEAKP